MHEMSDFYMDQLYDSARKEDKPKSFIGVGFDNCVTPIDMISIYLLNSVAPDLTFFVVDEFQKLNGKSDEAISKDRTHFLKSLNNFSAMYALENKVILASELMDEPAYKRKYELVKNHIEGTHIIKNLENTVPESKRNDKRAITYPLHEVTCCVYLSMDKGFTNKIGPSKERQYDNSISEILQGLNYYYLQNAYALGTKTVDPVVHYIPDSRGPNNGQRVFL